MRSRSFCRHIPLPASALMIAVAACGSDAAPVVDPLRDGGSTHETGSTEGGATLDANLEDALEGGDATTLDGATPDAGADAAPFDSGVLDATADAYDASTPTLRYFDYFHDGTSIHWISAHGQGVLAASAQVSPRHFPFSEGELAVDGKVSKRRASTIVQLGDALYRLDGSATTVSAPPQPSRVTTLQGFGNICYAWVASNLKDPSKSRLIFQHEAKCSTLGPRSDRPAKSVLLAATPTDVADDLPLGITPLISDEGEIDEVLQTKSNLLYRVKSLTDTTQLGDLSDLAFVYGVSAESIGSSRYLLSLYRADGKYELYVYDAAAHKLSTSLGKFEGDLGPLRAKPRDGSYVYFVGTKVGGPGQQLFRLKVTAPALEPLSGLAVAAPGALMLVDVAGGKIVYRTFGIADQGVFTVPITADFAAPPAATTLLSGAQFFPFICSSSRLFYQEGNFAKSIRLDGTGAEGLPGGKLSTWIGCTGDRNTDIPSHPELSERCKRVYVAEGLYAPEITSFDAAADPSGPFAASPNRDVISHGKLPDVYVQSPRIVGTTRSTSVENVPSLHLMTAVVSIKEVIGAPFRDAVFSLPEGGVNPKVATQTDPANNVTWLSRGP